MVTVFACAAALLTILRASDAAIIISRDTEGLSVRDSSSGVFTVQPEYVRGSDTDSENADIRSKPLQTLNTPSQLWVVLTNSAESQRTPTSESNDEQSSSSNFDSDNYAVEREYVRESESDSKNFKNLHAGDATVFKITAYNRGPIDYHSKVNSVQSGSDEDMELDAVHVNSGDATDTKGYTEGLNAIVTDGEAHQVQTEFVRDSDTDSDLL